METKKAVRRENPPSRILDKILKDPKGNGRIYIILGRPGLTGKTWLANKLKERGYPVIELSERINSFVDYYDDENHVLYDLLDGEVVIILNELFKEENK